MQNDCQFDHNVQPTMPGETPVVQSDIKQEQLNFNGPDSIHESELLATTDHCAWH